MKSKLYTICIIILFACSLFALTENETLLFKAVEESNIKEIERLIKIPDLNVNVLNEDGFAPIHIAVLNEDDLALKTLLYSKKINIEATIDNNTELNGWYLGADTALLLASYLNNINALNILINAKANILAKNTIDGALAIHIAAANGNNEIVSRLLEYAKSKKIDLIEMKDIRENTALHWAAMKGQTDTVSLLIKNGANINAIDEDGWSALHYAASDNNYDTVKLLLDNGASAQNKDYNGFNPAYYSSDKNVIALLGGETDEEYDEKYYEEDEYYYKEDKKAPVKNANILTTEQNEFMLAVKKGDIISINNLVKNGFNVNFTDSEGYTPIHRAVLYGKRTSLEAIIKSSNADIEAKLPSETEINGWYLGGATPLLIASYLGDDYSVLLLLDNAGANIFARDTIDGAMAIHIASANGHIKVVNAILSSKSAQKAGITKVLNSGDENNDTALSWAIMKGNTSVVDLLLKYGIDVNIKNIENETAVYYAASYSNPSVIEKLYESGAGLNEKNFQGSTPLHYAVRAGNIDNVKKLIELGADQNMKNKDGKTSYDIAEEEGEYEIAEYLLNLYTTIPSKKQKEKWWSAY